ncbi:MAG: PspC domain-containing protein [Saprospiraceae bacterium]|nr:PspC domain-containing protein [Chitinophagia bacterium]
MHELIRNFIEKSVFGVCSSIARAMGIRSSRVRLYFIYLSFVTIGSPIIIYLIMAFWLNLRKYLRKGYHLLID